MAEQGKLQHIYAEIDDYGFALLKARFNTTGRGRRKAIAPAVTSIHKQLLQICYLKDSMNASWKQVELWTSDLFPYCQVETVRYLIENTRKTVLKSSDEERHLLYTVNVDLDQIGPCSTKAGLTRSAIQDPTSLVSRPLTRGALLELWKSKEVSLDELFTLSETMHPGIFGKKDILISNLNAWNLAIRRKGRMTLQIKEYQDQVIPFPERNVPPTESTINTETANEKSQAENKAENRKLEHAERKTVELIKKKLSDTLQELNTLKQIYKEKCQDTFTLNDKMSMLCKTTSAIKIKNKELASELEIYKAKVKEISAELSKIKGTNGYKSMKRSLKYHKDNHQELQTIVAQTEKENTIVYSKLRVEIKDLKDQNLDIKKLLERLKTELVDYDKQEKGLRLQLSELKNELELLQSQQCRCCAENLVTRYDSRGKPFTEGVQICLLEIVGELGVSTLKAGSVICSVANRLFSKNVTTADLPKKTAVRTIMDKANVIAEIQIAEAMKKAKAYDVHVDATTRNGIPIIGQQITTSDNQTFSYGFNCVSRENSSTLMDNTINMLDQLAHVSANGATEKQAEYDDMLSRMFGLMSDRASVNKAYNAKMLNYSQEHLGTKVHLHFLYCNAHFLLGLANECEKTLRSLEERYEQSLGRNRNSKFGRFTSSESGVCRFIRTGCDVLGPRGDAKNGCRLEWESYCEVYLLIVSCVTSFRLNRFNNYFEGGGCLYFHRGSISEFFSTYKDHLNMKLESVKLDAECAILQAHVRAVGLIYYLITGPFWMLLESKTQYVDLHKYIQSMHCQFKEWSKDSADLLEQHQGVFPDFSISTGAIYAELLTDQGEFHNCITKTTLEEIFKGFIKVTERQLADFLPGGIYGQEATEELRAEMRHCKLTNLVSERDFGDLDYSQYRRRYASLHYHSTIQMLNKNKTISSFLGTKSSAEQSEYLQKGKRLAQEIRERHRAAEKQVRKELMGKMEEVQRVKMVKKAKKDETLKKLLERVGNNGGPCKCVHNVEDLLQKFSKQGAKLEAVKDEMRYLKVVQDIKDPRLIFARKCLPDLVDGLKALLSSSPCAENCKKSLCEPPSKKKKVDSADVLCAFRYSNLDMWVGVASIEGYFIGQVTHIQDEKNGIVQFLEKGRMEDLFIRPRLEDHANVEANLIFASDFEVTYTESGNRPTFCVPQLEYIKDLYTQYRTNILA